MIRCTRCVMPSTRPDTEFVDGVCSACLAYERRPEIDWAARRAELEALLERGRNASGYDCIVPSSGGKDSHYQVLTVLELGARPLVVTATTCQLTGIGRRNIENLRRYATTIEVSPNATARAALNRIGLELVGDISWPEHAGIFTTPFRIAAALGIPLLLYGENPQNQYGGPMEATEARQMTRRWVSEFGGFLGLRPMDCVGQQGLTERDMQDYMMPSPEALAAAGVEAHFLGQYLPWDSHANAKRAREAGMVQVLPCHANVWNHENLDNAQTGLHDHGMYRKYGYGRGCAQLSVDMRSRRIDRPWAMQQLAWRDGEFPHTYMGTQLETVLERLERPLKWLMENLDRHTNWALFSGVQAGKPVLKEFASAKTDGFQKTTTA